MERKEMIQYIVAFIAIMFVISMFYNFTRTPASTNKVINISTGTATTKCKILGYGTEAIIQPWNNRTTEIAKELKNNGTIDYINILGNKGVLVFSSKSNIQDIRNAYINENVDVLAQASCNVNGMVEFSLENGSVSKQAPGNIRIYLDPFSQVGEEIDVDLIAQISDSGIEYMSAQPFTRTADGSATAKLKCYDIYALVGNIKWENRNLNLSELKEIGINESNINYTKNDAVMFSRELNETERKEIEMKLNESRNNATVFSKGLITNSQDKEALTNILLASNITPSFPDSYLIVFTYGEKRPEIEDYIHNHGDLTKIQKGCDIILDTIGMRKDGKPVYIKESLRKLNYYLDQDRINENETVGINVRYELIGMVVESVEFQGLK